MSRGDGLARLRAALQDHGSTIRGQAARCPAHDDSRASLSIGQGEAGAVILCHAGCPTDAVLEALGLSAADLFDKPTEPRQRRTFQVTATYTYTDEFGTPAFYVERRHPKDFRQYRIVDGAKVWNLRGVTRVPYRLPELLEAATSGGTVFVTEGEKDADAIRAAGAVATTGAGGAGKWQAGYAAWFGGAGRVVVVADRDGPGRAHAEQVAASLRPVVAAVEVVEAAEGKDAADHLAAGRGLGEFRPAGTPEPAVPPPDDPAKLLHELHEWLVSYVAFPSAHAAVTVTLWIAHTHLAACFDSTGRLVLLSPEPECGKTRVLELCELTAAGAEFLNNASAAYLFRRIGAEDAGPVTLLLDEADAIWKRKGDENAEAIRSILNAGHRKGASVGRAENHGATLTRFPVYAPAAIAAKGDPLPDTIMSRAIVIHMRRRAADQQVRRYRARITRPEGEPLRDQLAAWAASVAGKVGDPWPDLPEGVDDRPADVWEPLVMVADLAGGDWPKLAREACAALVKGARDDSQTTGTRLLADLRDVFSAADAALFGHADVLFTSTILEALAGLDEAPWGGWNDGEGINARDLAKQLRPYGVRPRQVRIGGVTAKGYHRAELADQWSRYVRGSLSETSETSETLLASHVSDVSDVSHTRHECAVCGKPMDPALTDAGYTTHPGCDPDEVPI